MADGERRRCYGEPNDPLMSRYHDEEWGVPVHDDRALFESLVLDGFQAGLSWRTILQKRQNFRNAFGCFVPEKVASYGEADKSRLLADAGIVRNRLKIEAAIGNAQRFLDVQKEFGSFDRFIWGFTAGKTLRMPGIEAWSDVPAKTPEAEAMSIELRRRGFKFVGPTVCYAFMQTVGMVNDHLPWCFRAPKR